MQPATNLTDARPAEYDPPRIEKVLAPDDVAREVHYAGPGSPDTQK